MTRLYAWWIRLLARWTTDVMATFPPEVELSHREQRLAAMETLRTAVPDEDAIDASLRGAFADCGLALDQYHPDFDILHSGKLLDVLVHGSRRLGKPLVTVADLADLFR